MADMDTEIDVPLLLDQVEDNRSEQTLESPTEDELGVESLDYDPIHSFVSSQQKRAQQRRHFYGYKTNTFLFQLHPNTHTIICLFGEFDKFVFCKLRISKYSFMSIQGNDLKFQSQ
jgi:hypothetical protein